MDSRILKQRHSTKIISVPSLETGPILGPQAREEVGVYLLRLLSWGCSKPLLPWPGAWHSCSLNSERSRRTICQGAGGREPISIHCRQLFIWKSTSNVPIHMALLHFSTFMSVIAFIFLVKTAKQVIIYYITARIGWVCSHNNFNLPSEGLGG